MIISLIGMSGSGKTFWAKKLEKEGFKRFSIDDLLEAALEKKLSKLGYFGLDGVSKWMGQPFDTQYKKTSKAILALEEKNIEDVFDQVEAYLNSSQNIVVDTPGSIIYHKKEILNRLTKMTKIIYLKISQKAIKLQYEIYLNDPKPVIWGNIFKPEKGENNLQALARCYPKLLKYREARYLKLADFTLDSSILRNPSFTVEKFITEINSKYLPNTGVD